MAFLRFKRLAAIFAVLVVALTMASEASARPGGGGSFGSRGSRTFSAPPVTNTAPRSASPIERPYSPGQVSAPQPGRSGGFLSGGLGRGLVGGFLGAGLFGLLAGHGMFGGLGDGLSFLGLLIQIGVVVLVVRLIVGMFRNRQPAVSGMSNRMAGNGMAGSGMAGNGMGGSGSFAPGGGGSGAQNFNAPGPVQTSPVQIDAADFDMFQRRLGEVHGAYGAEDVATLRRLTTPQMADKFAAELSGNQRQGVVNRLSDVSLLQGDLSESWREEARDYATVAMRYTILDTVVDRASGRIVSGNPNRPDEVTELWTFVRPSGNGPSGWILSAIQQT